MQTNDGTKASLDCPSANLFSCSELRLKSITVQFNFFGECFLYDSTLLLVEHFLIWPLVGAIFRFRCDTEGAVKRNVKLRENFTQLRKQVFKANNSIDDDFAPRWRDRILLFAPPRARGLRSNWTIHGIFFNRARRDCAFRQSQSSGFLTKAHVSEREIPNQGKIIRLFFQERFHFAARLSPTFLRSAMVACEVFRPP